MLDQFEIKHLKNWLENYFYSEENRDSAYHKITTIDSETIRELINSNWTWEKILNTTDFKEII